jgi:lactoylglutathione lyase
MGEPQPHRLTESRLTHVALPCADLDRSIDFYTSVTPLVVIARHDDEHGRSAWLSNERQARDPFVLVLVEQAADASDTEAGAPAVDDSATDREPGTGTGATARPDRRLPTLTPFAHIGIEVPERADVDAVAALGRERGCLRWEPRQMPEHIGYICALEDPDGNVIEFSHAQKVFSTVRALWGEG